VNVGPGAAALLGIYLRAIDSDDRQGRGLGIVTGQRSLINRDRPFPAGFESLFGHRQQFGLPGLDAGDQLCELALVIFPRKLQQGLGE
jgi:hypothetical protein